MTPSSLIVTAFPPLHCSPPSERLLVGIDRDRADIDGTRPEPAVGVRDVEVVCPRRPGRAGPRERDAGPDAPTGGAQKQGWHLLDVRVRDGEGADAAGEGP